MKTNLTERMKAIADMVISGESAADIGTDHGYIPCYLIENGICPYVVLSDVVSGPLARAKANLAEYDGEMYDIRKGSGISVLNPGEVSSVIIAGMGGELIEDILGEDIEKSKSFKRIILQPRTKCDELRLWLSDHGFAISEYRLAREKERICEIFSVSPSNASDKGENPVISDVLLSAGDELLSEYIGFKISQRKALADNLTKSKKDESERILQTKKEIEYLLSVKPHE